MIKQACLAALVTVTSSASFSAPNYDHLYAFGDSYSDSGSGRALTKKMVDQNVKGAQELPGSSYWEGRWSNGPTAVEGLASSLNIPLTNYGVGGAKSGDGNYYTWMDSVQNTGLFGQIAEHLKSLKAGKADPHALYFIFVSANDFFEWSDFSGSIPISSLGQISLNNIKDAVEMLIASGAKHLMIVGRRI